LKVDRFIVLTTFYRHFNLFMPSSADSTRFAILHSIHEEQI